MRTPIETAKERFDNTLRAYPLERPRLADGGCQATVQNGGGVQRLRTGE